MTYCTWHPDRETGLTCGKCGRPICAFCMAQHPVGVRCKECARLRRIPTFQVPPGHYARAALVALVLGSLGSLTLGLLSHVETPSALGLVIFYLRPLVLVGIGYIIGEGVSVVVNRKRGRVLQVVAGAGVMVSVLVSVFFFADPFFLRNIFSLLALPIAVFIATSRVGS